MARELLSGSTGKVTFSSDLVLRRQGSGGGQATVERGAERAHVSVSSGSQAFGARGLERARTAEQSWL